MGLGVAGPNGGKGVEGMNEIAQRRQLDDQDALARLRARLGLGRLAAQNSRLPVPEDISE